MQPPQLVQVIVEQGILKGQRISQDGGPPYDAFRGIPYAHKPLGPLRFKAPRPPEPWEGVRPAVDEGPIASQLASGKVVGNEDCLYLNVYTPQVPSLVAPSLVAPSLVAGRSNGQGFRPGAPWPVMVWLHPGGFTSGSGSAGVFGPELLVAKDVVVVTINFRLGAFGFLSLESPAATGNYGLKDILAALRWIKRNGPAFGGDVDRITLFGSSAGAASVQLLQLAPAAKGLFQRAIAQSGSSLTAWAICVNPRERALRLARRLGATEKDLEDDESIMQFLQSQTTEAILAATAKIPIPDDFIVGLSYMFLPSNEKGLQPNDPDDEIFLPGHPRDLVKQGRVVDIPVIMGVNSAEGLVVDFLSGSEAIRCVPEVLAKYDKHLEIALLPELKKAFPDASQEQEAAVQRLRKVYFDGRRVGEATKIGYYNLQSDLLINLGVIHEARAYARHSASPVYVYKFNVKGKLNRISSRLGIPMHKLHGACHGDEISYLWTSQPSLPTLEQQSLEAQTRHRLVTLWTNFAKSGNPTPDVESCLDGISWPPLLNDADAEAGSSVLVPYLEIGAALTIRHDGFFKQRVQLWDSLYSQLQQFRYYI